MVRWPRADPGLQPWSYPHGYRADAHPQGLESPSLQYSGGLGLLIKLLVLVSQHLDQPIHAIRANLLGKAFSIIGDQRNTSQDDVVHLPAFGFFFQTEIHIDR